MSEPFDPPHDRPPSLLTGWNPFAALGLMVLSVLVWRFTIECLIAVGVVSTALIQGVSPEVMATNPESLVRVDILAVGTAVQLIGMVVVLTGCLRFVGWPVVASFGLRSAGAVQLGAALVAGGVVGFFSGFVNEFLVQFLPNNMAMQQQIVEALTGGPIVGRVLMIVAVVLVAPIFEELAFRGALWEATERAAMRATGDSPAGRRNASLVAFVLTSLGFAAYHLDPIHVLSLLPTAFMLGWLRHTSRSVWPGVLAHLVNNGLAAALAHLATDESESMPWWGALLALLVTLVACAVAWKFAPNTDEEPA